MKKLKLAIAILVEVQMDYQKKMKKLEERSPSITSCKKKDLQAKRDCHKHTLFYIKYYKIQDIVNSIDSILNS
jgi:hypothetical protein